MKGVIVLDVRQRSDKMAALKELASRGPRFVALFEDLASIPKTPFGYWAPASVTAAFRTLRRLGAELTVLSTNPLNLDFRYARCAWEVPPSPERYEWRPWSKGGDFVRFYRDVDMVIAWSVERQSYFGFLGTANRPLERPASSQYFFQPGLTWSRRSQRGLSVRALPAGCIFGDKGPFITDSPVSSLDLMAALALVNSAAFRGLVGMQMAFGSFEVGVLQQTPIPETQETASTLASLALEGWTLSRGADTAVEVSRAFLVPALLQVAGESLAERVEAVGKQVAAREAGLAKVQAEIDALCFELYGIFGDDRLAISADWNPALGADGSGADAVEEPGDAEDEAGIANADPKTLAAQLVSWAVGVATGRFDVRLADGPGAWPADPNPFDPLPKYSPATLTDAHGQIVALPPVGYPVEVSAVLVSDRGHRLDIEGRVRSVLDATFGSTADRWLVDLGSALGTREGELSAWLRKGFFDYHLRLHSKSRRKAPVLWPLGTPSGSYLVWLYAHRITTDSLFQVLHDVVVPKVSLEDQRLTHLRQDAGPSPTSSQRRAVDQQAAFVDELRELVELIESVAPLWAPDLNDGIVIVLAPLWRLFGHHRAWSKELKDHWTKLAAGDYDWAQLAMHLWPERVIPKCAEDRSLAIAHGLEDVFWIQDDSGVEKWHARKFPTTPADQLIAQRQNPAVQAALAGQP